MGEEKPVKEDEPSQMQLDSDSDEEIAEPTPKRDVKKEAEAIARKKKEQEALAHMFDDLDEDELKNEGKCVLFLKVQTLTRDRH